MITPHKMTVLRGSLRLQAPVTRPAPKGEPVSPCPKCNSREHVRLIRSSDAVIGKDPQSDGQSWHFCAECAVQFTPDYGMAMEFDYHGRPMQIALPGPVILTEQAMATQPQ